MHNNSNLNGPSGESTVPVDEVTFGEVKQKVDGLEKRVNNLKADVSAISRDVQATKESAAGMEQRVSQLCASMEKSEQRKSRIFITVASSLLISVIVYLVKEFI